MYSANPDPCLHNGPSGSEFRSNADPDPDQTANFLTSTKICIY